MNSMSVESSTGRMQSIGHTGTQLASLQQFWVMTNATALLLWSHAATSIAGHLSDLRTLSASVDGLVSTEALVTVLLPVVLHHAYLVAYTGQVSIYGLVERSDDSSRRASDLAWLHAASARLTDQSSHETDDYTPHNDIPVAVSESAAITTTFLRLLHRTPLDVVFDHPPPERLTAQLREMLLMLADEPQLADMCLRAMLVSEGAVSKARRHIGSEVGRRIRAALGTSAWPEVVDLFGCGLYGAVLQANYSAVSADELVDQLTDLVDIVFSQTA
jgi:hypothetical protein